MSENICLYCGGIIPEGRLICPSCERSVTPPCKDCEDRHLHCHGECERYEAYRRVLDDISEQKRNQRAGEKAFAAYKHDRRMQSWVINRSRHLKRFGREKKDNNG